MSLLLLLLLRGFIAPFELSCWLLLPLLLYKAEEDIASSDMYLFERDYLLILGGYLLFNFCQDHPTINFIRWYVKYVYIYIITSQSFSNGLFQ